MPRSSPIASSIGKAMTKRQKTVRTRIIITGILFAGLLALEHTIGGTLPGYVMLLLYLLPYGIVSYDVLGRALRNIRNGQVFDENFLMTIATFGALAIGEYAEAVAVMLFYQIGELFQSYAVGKSRESIAAMMEIVPEEAFLEEDGKLVAVDPDDVEIGQIIVVKPGDRIPLDGIVAEGESFLDTSALTGESVPRRTAEGDEVYSGCVNGSGTLRIRVTKEFDDCTVSKILEMVENATERKAKTENFITGFARFYTPVVTIGALILALAGPLLFGGNFMAWLHRACVFLVISCPCALVISVPLGFFGGIGSASRMGVLVKGSNYIEAVAGITALVCDKTGTLTKGEFRVRSIVPSEGFAEKELLETAALAEGYSGHPIASSIREAYGSQPDLGRVEDVQETAGKGIKARIDGSIVYAGNAVWMKEMGIPLNGVEASQAGTVVFIAKDGILAGWIVIADEAKEGAASAIAAIKAAGVKKTVMLTGDAQKPAMQIASELGIDEIHAELLPGDKVAEFEKILASCAKEDARGKVAFVGDGINDAPVLGRADIGFAMGSMGSDAAIEAADVVIMDDDLGKIARSIRLARKTMAIVRENIVFALAVKALILILGALGLAGMWGAVFADVGVSVIAILNSMRALH